MDATGSAQAFPALEGMGAGAEHDAAVKRSPRRSKPDQLAGVAWAGGRSRFTRLPGTTTTRIAGGRRGRFARWQFLEDLVGSGPCYFGGGPLGGTGAASVPPPARRTAASATGIARCCVKVGMRHRHLGIGTAPTGTTGEGPAEILCGWSQAGGTLDQWTRNRRPPGPMESSPSTTSCAPAAPTSRPPPTHCERRLPDPRGRDR